MEQPKKILLVDDDDAAAFMTQRLLRQSGTEVDLLTARHEIERTVNEKQSLMYEGLLKGLPDTEKEALLDYIVTLSSSSAQ